MAPHQVKLATGELVLAPFDEEAIIREHGAPLASVRHLP